MRVVDGTGARKGATLPLAIAAVWLLWGSTFAGMRLAVATIPPFAMASARFLIAGAILYAVCVARGRGRVTAGDLGRAAVTGATLLLFGNGLNAWTVQYLPTGLDSLLVSSAAVWMALIAYLWGGERPSAPGIVGIAVGLLGVGLLADPAGAGALPLGPTVVALGASLSWAFGSIYQRRTAGADVVLATALQMLLGGAFLGVEALVTGDWSRLHLAAISPGSWAGFAWLIVGGSIVGYCAYLYTMRAASATLAAAYAYVNPIVALGLGELLFGERLSVREGVAGAIVVAGVALMAAPAPRWRVRSMRERA